MARKVFTGALKRECVVCISFVWKTLEIKARVIAPISAMTLTLILPALPSLALAAGSRPHRCQIITEHLSTCT